MNSLEIDLKTLALNENTMPSQEFSSMESMMRVSPHLFLQKPEQYDDTHTA
jgi:hypothetical protein